jgi:hypothetical protein
LVQPSGGKAAPTVRIDERRPFDHNCGHGEEAPIALVYADEVKQHLGAIETKYHSLIQSAVEDQLLHEPDGETRNRKPLKRPIAFGADWELRLGPNNRFRVFYQVNAESRAVRVLAVGFKDRNRLFVGGEEFEG